MLACTLPNFTTYTGIVFLSIHSFPPFKRWAEHPTLKKTSPYAENAPCRCHGRKIKTSVSVCFRQFIRIDNLPQDEMRSSGQRRRQLPSLNFSTHGIGQNHVAGSLPTAGTWAARGG